MGNDNGWFNQRTLDAMAFIGFLIGVANYEENLSQSDVQDMIKGALRDVHEHLEEQDNKLKQFPDFWGHLEIKADALFHLNRVSEAKSFYQEALKNTAEDKHLSKSEMREVTKRLRTKIKKCSKILR